MSDHKVFKVFPVKLERPEKKALPVSRAIKEIRDRKGSKVIRVKRAITVIKVPKVP